MIRVLIADDHLVVRSGLEQLLATAPDIEVVGSAADGAAAADGYAEHRPDVVLMDLSMPGTDGIEATRRIVASDPSAVIVVLTSFSEDRRIRDALEAGATGYLLKHAAGDDLLDAIRAAAEGEAPMDPKASRVLLDAARARRRPAQALSEREEEVLRLVADGLANKAIARRLSITERTVKAHLTNIFARLGVTDRTQAALWARDNLGS